MRSDIATRQGVAELEAHECAGGVARNMIITCSLDIRGHGKPFVSHVRCNIR